MKTLGLHLAVVFALITCVGCGAPQQPTVDVASMRHVGFDHSATLNTCIQCHANDRPTAPVGPNNFSHSMNGAFGDCVSCHAVDRAKVGVTWQIQ